MKTYEDLLLELAEADERVVVMTAENRATIRNLPAKLGARFIDTGITEQTLVGSATGLAMGGRVPIIHALAAFLTMRAFEFIRTDIGISAAPVKLVGFVPGFLSDGNGPTHQAIEDVSLMRGIPGMRVFAPSDRADLLAGLPAVVADPKPWYIRYYDAPSELDHEPFEIGKAETLRQGTDVTILTYGMVTRLVVEAAKQLEANGVSAKVVNMRTLVPADQDALLDALASPLCVTVEDHFAIGGLGSILAETALAHGVTGQHVSIAFDGTWYKPGRLAEVLDFAGFTPPQLTDRILKALGEL